MNRSSFAFGSGLVRPSASIFPVSTHCTLILPAACSCLNHSSEMCICRIFVLNVGLSMVIILTACLLPHSIFVSSFSVSNSISLNSCCQALTGACVSSDRISHIESLHADLDSWRTLFTTRPVLPSAVFLFRSQGVTSPCLIPRGCLRNRGWSFSTIAWGGRFSWWWCDVWNGLLYRH